LRRGPEVTQSECKKGNKERAGGISDLKKNTRFFFVGNRYISTRLGGKEKVGGSFKSLRNQRNGNGGGKAKELPYGRDCAVWGGRGYGHRITHKGKSRGKKDCFVQRVKLLAMLKKNDKRRRKP